MITRAARIALAAAGTAVAAGGFTPGNDPHATSAAADATYAAGTSVSGTSVSGTSVSGSSVATGDVGNSAIEHTGSVHRTACAAVGATVAVVRRDLGVIAVGSATYEYEAC
ncbi:hypothetical protein [Actinoplanes sp. NPDC051494]|uniref:hypothetical protein n=1 Tax=Actinoplanes sp. NPDC051494 TaxID=3363907 RepID=UPI003797F999